MAPQIHGDQAVFIAQVGVELPVPGKGTLRNAVNEKDGPAPQGTRFDNVELRPSAACDSMRFHPVRWLEGAA